jgi:hypothetical protein
MATEQNFSIRKGRTCTVTVTITGVSVWTDLVARLFADYDLEVSAPLIVLTGTINQGNSTASFDFTNQTTLELVAQSSLRYEVGLYKSDGSYIKDTNYGLIHIGPVVKEHPNT